MMMSTLCSKFIFYMNLELKVLIYLEYQCMIL